MQLAFGAHMCVSVCVSLPAYQWVPHGGPEIEGERLRIFSSCALPNLPPSESPSASWWVEQRRYRPTGSTALAQEIFRLAAGRAGALICQRQD